MRTDAEAHIPPLDWATAPAGRYLASVRRGEVDPIQYDELRIEHDESVLEIVVHTGQSRKARERRAWHGNV